MIKEIIERLQYIDILIQEHKTGTAADLGEVIGVSERTVYKYLKMMKRHGAPIAFNAFTKTYYYKKEGSFICAFSFSANTDAFQRTSMDNLKSLVVSREEFLSKMFMNVILNKN